ncbi:MAG: methionine--tRNA ligase subunit beta, partial [bacterium]
MPETGHKMFRQTGIVKMKELHTVKSLEKWGALPGRTRTFRGPALFPRIEEVPEIGKIADSASPEDVEKPKRSKKNKKRETGKGEREDNMISIEDFATVELIAARILEAEKVPKSKKLIRLIVDAGDERQLVAGIAENYEPEDLVGKTIAIVANLKPAKLMGVESRGMLLAAEDDSGIHVLTFDEDVKPGTRIK